MTFDYEWISGVFTGYQFPVRSGPQGVVGARIAKEGEDTICTSISVAAELRCGAAKSNSGKLAERIDLILSALTILPLETPADHQYATTSHVREHPLDPMIC